MLKTILFSGPVSFGGKQLVKELSASFSTNFNLRFTSRNIASEIKSTLITTSYLLKKNTNNAGSYFLFRGFHENISALQMKKRPIRKKRVFPEDEEDKLPGVFSVIAFTTAEEYNLENLMSGLTLQGLYEPKMISSSKETPPDVLHAVAKYSVGAEPRDIYFFREGSVVLWNVTEMESSNVLGFIKPYELDRYTENLVIQEAEAMNYLYDFSGKTSQVLNGDFVFCKTGQIQNEKYTFSNAMALSVKLGIWEASLDRYVNSIEFVTEDLKRGNKIKMSREEVLRKHGELFALRHLINLSSDLLDTPDFYWERDQLEGLYSQTVTYFSIPRRTRVMNEKINHCVELIELLSSHLSDKHHIRLEWMIIVLIMVEVAFETIHYADRFLS